jgi:hypothetical protein
MRVPFVDLGPAHRHLREGLMSVFRWRSTPTSSSAVAWCRHSRETSRPFARTRFCVGVNSGTDALRFALVAAGVRPGELW